MIFIYAQKNHGRKVNTQTYFGEGVTDSLNALSNRDNDDWACESGPTDIASIYFLNILA